MDATKYLEELLGDYPRIWHFYKTDYGEKARAAKYSQRYPLPMGTLSMVLDFHKWVSKTAKLIAEETGLPLPKNARPSEAGPDPLVIIRLHWLRNAWSSIEAKRSLAKTIGEEIVGWHTRIRVKVNDGDIYSYTASVICSRCQNRTVMRMNDKNICVNSNCRDPFTGEWFSWQIT